MPFTGTTVYPTSADAFDVTKADADPAGQDLADARAAINALQTKVGTGALIAYARLVLTGSIATGDLVNNAVTSGKIATAVTDLLPTVGQKNALAGAHGTPGTGTEYLTKSSLGAAGVAGKALAADDGTTTNSRAPSGTAGGVLGGNYPNPSFAADMATQAELDVEKARLDAVESIHAYIGTAVPVMVVPDGATYSRLDANDQWIEEYHREGGVWVLKGGPAPFCEVLVASYSLANTANVSALDLSSTAENEGFTVDLTANTITTTRAGVFQVGARATFATSSATGVRKLEISTAAATPIGDHRPGTASANHKISMAGDIRLAAGDYIYGAIAQSSGAAMNVSGFVTMRWVRP